MQFVDSAHARELAFLGTSCPDHFIRTKIRPLFVPWAQAKASKAEDSRSTAAGRVSQAVSRLLSAFATAGFAGDSRCQPRRWC